MRTAPTALKTWLAVPGNTASIRADLITITLLGGVFLGVTVAPGAVLRWTTWPNDLVVSGNTFNGSGAGSAPVVKRGTYSQSAQLTIDTLDVTLGGPFSIGGKSLGALAAAGYFRGGTIQVDHLIMAFPGDVGVGALSAGGPIPKWFSGPISIAEMQGPNTTLRCKSELELFNIQLPKFDVQPTCGNAVYDANCTLSKATFTTAPQTVIASPAPTVSSFAFTGAFVVNYFNLGVVVFTSGALAGQKRMVTTSTAGTTVLLTLQRAFSVAPAAGDTFTVYPGCDKSLLRCGVTFNNLVNFRGLPFAPTSQEA